ncbi:MAG TPA: hypothetical protein PKC72_04575 [Chitinophagaceae bacterium]|nr:hypothetical protein [Chitinophagaceae bacterium]
MDSNQPTAQPVYASSSSPGIFGTKIPSSVTFIVAVLLFFMPFIDIKCNNMSLQQVNGIQLATGFQMKNNSSGNSFLNDIKTDDVDNTITKTTTKTDKKDPNLFAMVALGLGILGLILSFTNAKAAIGGAMITGVLSAASLIGLMIDIKKKVKMDMPKTSGDSDGGILDKSFDKIGKSMSDSLNISVDFTPWFYIALIAFLAAAVFSYLRMTSKK